MFWVKVPVLHLLLLILLLILLFISSVALLLPVLLSLSAPPSLYVWYT